MAGNNLFKANIAKEIHKALSPNLLSATLTTITRGDRTSGSLTSGPALTETTHTCKGFIDSYKDGQIDGTIIKRGDRKVMIIADSISPTVVPEPHDKITIESSTFKIVNVDRDPDIAAYTMQVR